MTRPETLVRQLADAYLLPLEAQAKVVRNRSFPPPPVPTKVRALFHEYRLVSKRAARLQTQLRKLGANHYGSRPSMANDGAARTAALEAVSARIAKVKGMRQSAMLAVLGLDAAKARPIVLKLKADLEKLR